MANRGIIMNRAEAARCLGITPPTLDRWVAQGCPVHKEGGRGRSYEFNTADLRDWENDRTRAEGKSATNATETELLRRELAAKTELAELKLAREKGEVAPIEQFERAMSMVFGEVRSKLRTIPNRAAPRVVGEADDNKVRAILKDEIDLALQALSDERLLDPEDLEGEAEGEGE